MLRGRRRVAALIALLLGALIAILGAWRFGSGASTPTGAGPIAASADGDGTRDGERGFSVSGSVDGLFPGAHGDLVVTVMNAMPFAIRVTRVSATVGDASLACTAANLAVGSFTGSRQVPARGSATVTLPVALSYGAGDACQGGHFPLRYSATAARADAPPAPSATACASPEDEPCG